MSQESVSEDDEHITMICTSKEGKLMPYRFPHHITQELFNTSLVEKITKQIPVKIEITEQDGGVIGIQQADDDKDQRHSASTAAFAKEDNDPKRLKKDQQHPASTWG